MSLMALETAAGQLIYGMAYGRPVGPELTVSVRTVHLRISFAAAGRRTKRVAGARGKDGLSGRFQPGSSSAWGDQRLVARCAAMEPIAAGRDVYMTVEPRRVVLLGAGNS